MKNLFRIILCLSVITLASCGKKKCNTCPDWGKAQTDTHQIEEA